jgi:hypothetical protein
MGAKRFELLRNPDFFTEESEANEGARGNKRGAWNVMRET